MKCLYLSSGLKYTLIFHLTSTILIVVLIKKILIFCSNMGKSLVNRHLFILYFLLKSSLGLITAHTEGVPILSHFLHACH